MNEINEIVKSEQNIAITIMQKIDELVDTFINSQDVKESSKSTYRRTLKQYFSWIYKNGYSLNEITRQHVLEYKNELLNKGKSSLTVGSYITVVRKFYEWTESNKIYPNVAKGVKSPTRIQAFRKRPLSVEQINRLLDYFSNKDIRDYAIVNLLLRTGLRTIEVVRANVEDITFKGSQRVLLIQGKGRVDKDNFVILTDKTFEPIRRYLDTRGKVSGSEPLFISNSNNSKGNRLTTRTISYIVKEGLKEIGLDERCFTAHSLRHTTAVNILIGGGTLEMVQFTLRHTNPSTTQIYTSTLNEIRRLQGSGEALLDKIF
ncbi:MAG: tyrosine-type recombinase/integrase [Candidatus Izemoplasmatales bacterium]|jgi:integrase/recombinase XerD|nr:tyrosine-type recombinase/integrase [Bacteroidales bacterium]MDD3756412.1 tyrosine-type recombinase/integrase [Bacteroidales bacterium]MDY0138942.1 tyrosine-type recombinase/integrase [Candidatus Izemoplasmatales bacterium]